MPITIIQPIVAFVALILHIFFGINLDESQMEIITNGIVAITLAVVTVVTSIKALKDKKGK